MINRKTKAHSTCINHSRTPINDKIDAESRSKNTSRPNGLSTLESENPTPAFCRNSSINMVYRRACRAVFRLRFGHYCTVCDPDTGVACQCFRNFSQMRATPRLDLRSGSESMPVCPRRSRLVPLHRGFDRLNLPGQRKRGSASGATSTLRLRVCPAVRRRSPRRSRVSTIW